MSTETLTYEEIARLAFRLEYDFDRRPSPPRTSSYGALADLGPAPSAEEIDEARRELWGSGREEDTNA